MFVGRQRVLAELVERLSCDATLVTLWGTGGAGKSRTARELASTRGCVWVDLSAARSATDVVEALASSLTLSLSARDEALGGIAGTLWSRRRATTRARARARLASAKSESS